MMPGRAVISDYSFSRIEIKQFAMVMIASLAKI